MARRKPTRRRHREPWPPPWLLTLSVLMITLFLGITLVADISSNKYESQTVALALVAFLGTVLGVDHLRRDKDDEGRDDE